MEIKIITPPDGSNSYILTQNGADAVVIDPSSPAVISALKEKGLICRYAILTHGHFDHVGACGELEAAGAKILCGEGEDKFIFSAENLGVFGGVQIPPFKVYKTLKDGQKIDLCGIEFEVISTPGHSAGSVCYLCADKLFSGDLLFCGSVGRWDLPTGDYTALMQSLNRINSAFFNLEVYPGHGETTTLERERATNPFFKLR